jgi:hypothetical protein
MRMMPILMKLLAISMEANRIFGCSSRFTILLKEGCFFVLSTLMSLLLSEKKATSLPAIKKESTNNTSNAKRSMVVAAELMASNWS